ncbi:hypothetical protein HS7_03770 [Sulfolobales archaeon HS-7]|nr:hypothetical protein HS7_03770 [Sulfolobales archaeon HS-7]
MKKWVRTLLFSAIFSVAAFAVDAGFTVGLSSYAISPILDPFLEFTIPLMIIVIGFNVINSRPAALEIALISALVYAASSLLFLVPGIIISGVIIEGFCFLIGYRGLKASLAQGGTFAVINGILSFVFGALFLGAHSIIRVTPTLILILTPAFLVEGIVIGSISWKIFNYMMKSGIIKS